MSRREGSKLVERPDAEVCEAVVDLLTEELEHVAHARLARSEVGHTYARPSITARAPSEGRG